jgi:hypothetical protein
MTQTMYAQVNNKKKKIKGETVLSKARSLNVRWHTSLHCTWHVPSLREGHLAWKNSTSSFRTQWRFSKLPELQNGKRLFWLVKRDWQTWVLTHSNFHLKLRPTAISLHYPICGVGATSTFTSV